MFHAAAVTEEFVSSTAKLCVALTEPQDPVNFGCPPGPDARPQFAKGHSSQREKKSV